MCVRTCIDDDDDDVGADIDAIVAAVLVVIAF